MQQATKPTTKDFVQIALFLAVVYYFWPQLASAYNYFFKDNSPVTIAPGALTETDLPDIISTSQTNDLRFKSVFIDKQFVAAGIFKEANKDLARYHIAAEVGTHEVACDTTDTETLKVVSGLAPGDVVKIYGVINDTWMGALQLQQCAVSRPDKS